jgi:hypothetical protein
LHCDRLRNQREFGNRLVSGWQLGIITQAQSGNPLTILFFPNNTLTLRPNISAPLNRYWQSQQLDCQSTGALISVRRRNPKHLLARQPRTQLGDRS